MKLITRILGVAITAGHRITKAKVNYNQKITNIFIIIITAIIKISIIIITHKL